MQALEADGITQPSVIQARVVVPLLAGVSVIAGAATGSGKTLAYLLPLLQKLKNEELLVEEKENGDEWEDDYDEEVVLNSVWRARASKRPRAVVLAPTRELAQQVFMVAKHLSHFEKCRVVSLVGGDSSLKKQQEALSRSPVDVVVSTTGRLLQHIDAKSIDLRDCKTVVIDEVDTMFDQGFGPELKRIILRIRQRMAALRERDLRTLSAESGSGTSTVQTAASERKARNDEKTRAGGDFPADEIQFVAVGATHPEAAEALYAETFPRAKRINADLHVVPRGLLQRFVSLTPQEKTAELLALLGNTPAASLAGGRMIVFANTIDSCRFVDHFLNEHGFTTSCVHGSMPAETRASNYAAFKGQNTQLLVCTDIAARGLDNLAIDHVVMFDFPTSAVDYLHRAGRTARAGRKGIVTSFVTRRDATLARVMERSTRARADALRSETDTRRALHLRAKKEETAARRSKLLAKGAPTPGRKNLDPIDSRSGAATTKTESSSSSSAGTTSSRKPSAKARVGGHSARHAPRSRSNRSGGGSSFGNRRSRSSSSSRGRSTSSRRGTRR